MSSEVFDIATPDLVTETTVDATRVEGRLVGCAEASTLDDLTVYLDAIRRAAVATKSTEIVLDIRALEFMSAACLRSLLGWMAESQRAVVCPLRVVWDPTCAWQRRTLRPILSSQGAPVFLQ